MGTKERKERELIERKQFIIDKSKELFFNKGYSNVSVNDICEAIEYGRSAVYSIFKSKEEIYGYIYVEAITILADLMNSIKKDDVKLDNLLSIATYKVFEFYTHYKQYYKAVFFFDTNHMAYHKIPQYLLDKKIAEKQRAMKPIAELMLDGQKNAVYSEFDIFEILDTYYYSIIGIINNHLSVNNDKDTAILKSRLETHAQIYQRGLIR